MQLDEEKRQQRKLIGAHVSISKGIHQVQERMNEIGADTCGLFLKNQRQFGSKPLEKSTVLKFKDSVKSPELIVPHGSYLVNLANSATLERSYSCFLDDLKRCELLGIKYYNMHPGSDTEKKGKGALSLIARGINRALCEVEDVVILLENSAGQGRSCGRTFEELRWIIEEIEDKSRVGVTLDTCHLFGGGYDIRTAEGFESILREFDREVGLSYLKAMHLNDSKEALGSRKDRHESIGSGMIGLDAFRFIMNSEYFDGIPMILETPDAEKYKDEIDLLRSL